MNPKHLAGPPMTLGNMRRNRPYRSGFAGLDQGQESGRAGQ